MVVLVLTVIISLFWDSVIGSWPGLFKCCFRLVSGKLKAKECHPVALRWYVVHTYSGYENRVKTALQDKVRSLGLEDRITDVLIPSESVVELVKGERRTSNRKFSRGTFWSRWKLDDQTWHIVKSTPKVTGFIGSRTEPAVIPDDDVDKIKSQMAEGQDKPKPKYSFEKGDSVRVVDGPFINFNGTVEEVRPDKGKLRVLVSIFGRPTLWSLNLFRSRKIKSQAVSRYGKHVPAGVWCFRVLGRRYMAKKITATVKLQIPGGEAKPSPPVGPALGQHGVNIMEFCKAFNAQTQNQTGVIIPC